MGYYYLAHARDFDGLLSAREGQPFGTPENPALKQ